MSWDGPSGAAIADVSLSASVNRWFARAAAASLSSGVANAMPPPTIVATDWVFSFRPFASSDRSIPLAFQKRVSVVTSRSYGASMNTCRFMSRRCMSSLYDATWPTIRWR